MSSFPSCRFSTCVCPHLSARTIPNIRGLSSEALRACYKTRCTACSPAPSLAPFSCRLPFVNLVPLGPSLFALPPTRTVHNNVRGTRTSLCPGPVCRFAHGALQPFGHPSPSVVPPLGALCPLCASASSLLLVSPLGRALSLPSPSCSALPLLPLCQYPLGMMHDSVHYDTHLSYPRAGYIFVSLDACPAHCLPPVLQNCVDRHVAGADQRLKCLSTPHSSAGQCYHASAQVKGLARMIHDTLRGMLLFGPHTLPRSLFWSLSLRVPCAPWPLFVCPLSRAHGTQQCAGSPLPSPCPYLPSSTLVGRFRFFSFSLPLYAHGAEHPRPPALQPPAAATDLAGAAAAGSLSKCRGGRGPDRPRLPPGKGFTVPPAAPGRRGGSITKSCKTSEKKKTDTHTHTHIYIYTYTYIYIDICTCILLHPSPLESS